MMNLFIEIVGTVFLSFVFVLGFVTLAYIFYKGLASFGDKEPS